MSATQDFSGNGGEKLAPATLDAKGIFREIKAPHYVFGFIFLAGLAEKHIGQERLHDFTVGILSRFTRDQALAQEYWGAAQSTLFNGLMSATPFVYGLLSFMVFASTIIFVLYNKHKQPNRRLILRGCSVTLLARLIALAGVGGLVVLLPFELSAQQVMAVWLSLLVFWLLPPSSVYTSIALNAFPKLASDVNMAATVLYSILLYFALIILTFAVVLSSPELIVSTLG